jgi:hypothetical protein
MKNHRFELDHAMQQAIREHLPYALDLDLLDDTEIVEAYAANLRTGAIDAGVALADYVNAALDGDFCDGIAPVLTDTEKARVRALLRQPVK